LLRYSIDTTVVDGAGNIVCGDASGGPDNTPCVPVNMFAPSLYANLTNNDFATQAERDYLFADRTFDTQYTQSLAQFILTGDLFEMPAGDVLAAIGYEFRRDEIDSIPNRVARDGLLIGFFRDLGAVGEKDTKEWFAEVEVPLVANTPGAEELTVNLSTRHTDDEFYGGAWTYSAKLAYRPTQNLLLKGTVGTSYRAPNLRENFLDGTSGFRGLFDPCVTPESAITPEIGGGFTYDPAGETRTQTVIDNCIAAGVDPTFLGVTTSGQTIDTYSVEVLAGVGQTDLVEEQSESWTAGMAWDVPGLENIGLTIGATYYETEITDEIIELFSQTSINNCYNDPELDSTFCRNITRNVAGDGLISGVDEAFLNRDSLKTRGVDINVSFDWPVQMFGRAVDLSGDFNFNRKLEFSDVFFNIDTGEEERDSDLGEFGLPEWEGQMILRADVNDFRATWSTRYISSVQADPDLLDANDFGNWNEGTANTCLGEAAGDVDCRPIGWADNYFRHDLSFYYYGDQWTVGAGARNVTNERPPEVDGRVVFSGWNTPFGAGYDIQGRTYFLNVAVRFDDLTF
jgi:iron complex outermembrane receptor protein